MPAMRFIQTTATQWGLRTSVPRLLYSAGAQCISEQATGCGDAGSDREVSCEPWPGASAGVRRPEAWETKLSESEIAVGLMSGVIG